MIRALSMFSLGALFLVISPKLRLQVFDAIGVIVTTIMFWAPYSYVLGVLLIITTLIYSFNRGSQAR